MMPIRNQKARILKAAEYCSLFGSGFVLSKWIDMPYFYISQEIDIVALLSIAVTVWLAIIITTYFEKRNNNYRVEKDLIIGRIGNILEMCALLQIECVTGKISFTDAASSIKRMNVGLSSIYKMIEKCQFSISSEIKGGFKAIISDLRETLTNTPKINIEQINSTDMPIEIKSGIIYFNSDRIAQIEVKFESLKDLLLEFQIEINSK